jgi:hypothetical protein
MPQFRKRSERHARTKFDQETRRGHELVAQMARGELAEQRQGNSPQFDSPQAPASWRQAYRDLGVVLAPAVAELDGLDVVVFQPLRDVAYLTARTLDNEVRELVAAGVLPARAFAEAAAEWTEGFGALIVADEEAAGERPDALFAGWEQGAGAALARHESFPYRLDLLYRSREEAARGAQRVQPEPGLARALRQRMDARREVFARYDLDFEGGGHRETVRVIFVTALMLTDEVRGSEPRWPSVDFPNRYQWIARQYRTVTARLVVGG